MLEQAGSPALSPVIRAEEISRSAPSGDLLYTRKVIRDGRIGGVSPACSFCALLIFINGGPYRSPRRDTAVSPHRVNATVRDLEPVR